MAEAPGTRPSLLIRIRDASDTDAWRQFVDLYGALINRYARCRGLQAADADDLTQLVLLAISEGIGRLEYDAFKGTFRAWLYTIVRRQLSQFFARQQHVLQGSGDSKVHDRLQQQPDRDDADAELWEQEYRQQRFLWAADRARVDFQERTWQAFWRTAVHGEEPRGVAEALGLSIGALYTARARVLNRIREEVRLLEGNDE